MFEPRFLSLLEEEICRWLLRIDRVWTTLDPQKIGVIDEDALERLVGAGQIEAKLAVRVYVHGLRRPLRTLWLVSGQYHDRLRHEVMKRYRQRLYGPQIELDGFVAVRLSTDGVSGKALVAKHFRAGVQLSGYSICAIEPATGGPDAKHGLKAAGLAEFVEGDDLPEDPDAPLPSAPVAAAAAGPTTPGGVPFGLWCSPLTLLPIAMKAVEDAVLKGGQRAPEAVVPEAVSDGGLPRASAANEDRMLTPGEQAERLLGPLSEAGRDRQRRLQITGEVRRKALAARFLRPDDVEDTGVRSKGVRVRAGAWELPVAWFKAIRVAARTDEAANRQFPNRDAGAGKEWYVCQGCADVFRSEPSTRRCPKCGSDAELLDLRRA